MSRYKIQDTRCIFRASLATLSGFSTEKGHKQVLLKSITNMQVQVIRYMNAGDDDIETFLGLLATGVSQGLHIDGELVWL